MNVNSAVLDIVQSFHQNRNKSKSKRFVNFFLTITNQIWIPILISFCVVSVIFVMLYQDSGFILDAISFKQKFADELFKLEETDDIDALKTKLKTILPFFQIKSCKESLEKNFQILKGITIMINQGKKSSDQECGLNIETLKSLNYYFNDILKIYKLNDDTVLSIYDVDDVGFKLKPIGNINNLSPLLDEVANKAKHTLSISENVNLINDWNTRELYLLGFFLWHSMNHVTHSFSFLAKVSVLLNYFKESDTHLRVHGEDLVIKSQNLNFNRRYNKGSLPLNHGPLSLTKLISFRGTEIKMLDYLVTKDKTKETIELFAEVISKCNFLSSNEKLSSELEITDSNFRSNAEKLGWLISYDGKYVTNAVNTLKSSCVILSVLCVFCLYYHNIVNFLISPIDVCMRFINMFNPNVGYIKYNVLNGIFDNITGVYKFVLLTYTLAFIIVFSLILLIFSRRTIVSIAFDLSDELFFVTALFMILISVVYCTARRLNCDLMERDVLNDSFSHLDSFFANGKRSKLYLLNKIKNEDVITYILAILGLVVIYLFFTFGRLAFEYLAGGLMMNNFSFNISVCDLSCKDTDTFINLCSCGSEVASSLVYSVAGCRITVFLILIVFQYLAIQNTSCILFFVKNASLFSFITSSYDEFVNRVKISKLKNISIHIDKFAIFEVPYSINDKKLSEDIDVYKIKDLLLKGNDLSEFLENCPDESLKQYINSQLNNPENVLFRDVHLEIGEHKGKYGLFTKVNGSDYVYHIQQKTGLKCQIEGASGSGKSSLVEMLCGKRAHVNVSINGECASNIDPFSIYGIYHGTNTPVLFNTLSVKQNYSLASKLSDAIEDLKSAGLHKVVANLGSRTDSLALSFGERNRAESIMAIGFQRKFPVRFHDEVLEGLDEKNKSILCGILNKDMNKVDADGHYPIRFVIDHDSYETVSLKIKIVNRNEPVEVLVNTNKNGLTSKFIRIQDLDFGSKNQIEYDEFIIHRFKDEGFTKNKQRKS